MIAIVFCGDLKYCPYIKRYTERLHVNNIDYEVLFWNRAGDDLNLEENYKYFNCKSSLSKQKVLKIFDFMNFKIWLNKQFRKNNYSRIIVLSTLSGLLIYNILMQNKKKYIFDIRDYSYENIKIIYRLEKKIILNSYKTVISSKGFKSFLPKYDYVIAHNFNRNDILKKNTFNKNTIEPITIVWNGVMRYFGYQRQYIDAFKNDKRFELIYYGDGPELELYKEYIKNNNIQNIYFKGKYNNEDKYKILSNANILNNCYGNIKKELMETKYAISNRYYDGLIYHIPQIVEESGYKTDLVNHQCIGLNPKIDKGLADQVYNYYMSIDQDEFNKNCEKYLKKVIEEDDNYIQLIDRFIVGG